MVTRNHPGIVATIDELKPAGVEVAQEIKPDVSTTDTMGHTGAANQFGNLDRSGAGSDHVRAVFVPIPAPVVNENRATRAACLFGPAVPLELGFSSLNGSSWPIGSNSSRTSRASILVLNWYQSKTGSKGCPVGVLIILTPLLVGGVQSPPSAGWPSSPRLRRCYPSGPPPDLLCLSDQGSEPVVKVVKD